MSYPYYPDRVESIRFELDERYNDSPPELTYITRGRDSGEGVSIPVPRRGEVVDLIYVGDPPNQFPEHSSWRVSQVLYTVHSGTRLDVWVRLEPARLSARLLLRARALCRNGSTLLRHWWRQVKRELRQAWRFPLNPV